MKAEIQANLIIIAVLMIVTGAITFVFMRHPYKVPMITTEYVDSETGVHYIRVSGGITPRLNSDGSVMIDEEEVN